MDFSIFDEPINRINTLSLKWDALQRIYGSDDLLPMWVADMDIPSPECIQQALLQRINHPIFGYTYPSESLYTSIVDWLKIRHNWVIERNWITFNTGVVNSISMAIQAFTKMGDSVLIQSPVYTPFFHMIKNNGRIVVNNELKLNNNCYTIDFRDFEEKLKGGVKLFLLCSPHNPGGHIWEKEELQKMGELCLQYKVMIVSDEIHADLFHSSFKHYPIAAINETIANNTITLMSPSKTFNIAGLQASFLLTSNQKLKLQFEQFQANQGFHGINVLGLTAMEAAYRDGLKWLEELIAYIEENVKTAETYIAKEIPQLRCIHPEASYLLWIDCRQLNLTDQDIQDRLIKKGKLALELGKKYGPGGEGFVRMNLGCSKSILFDGLNRLKRAFTEN